MQLRLKRTQREGGVISKNVIFCLTARVQFTDEERRNLQKYKLWNQVIYNSESAKQSLAKSDAAYASGSTGGYLKSMVHTAMAALKLNISVRSLEQGQYVECKDMDELLAAEEAVYQACGNLKEYLALAATFDGTEVLVDFSQDRPEITAHPAIANPAPVASMPKPASVPVAAIAPPVVTPAETPAEEAIVEEPEEPSAEHVSEPVAEYETEDQAYAAAFGDQGMTRALEYGGTFADQTALDDFRRLWERNPGLVVGGGFSLFILLIALYNCSG